MSKLYHFTNIGFNIGYRRQKEFNFNIWFDDEGDAGWLCIWDEGNELFADDGYITKKQLALFAWHAFRCLLKYIFLGEPKDGELNSQIKETK